MTREEWLNEAVLRLRPYFERAGHPIPERVRVTCGFPSKMALSKKKRRIGECWSNKNSADQHFEILITPLLDDTLEVVAILVHELCHAAVGLEHGHKKPFVVCARALHLEGKPTATFGGEAFKREVFEPLRASLTHRDYPHGALSAFGSDRKVQTTRLLKCECNECGYVARVTRKWIDELGAPVCPGCSEPLSINN